MTRTPLLDRINDRKPAQREPLRRVPEWVKRAQERRLPAVDRTNR